MVHPNKNPLYLVSFSDDSRAGPGALVLDRDHVTSPCPPLHHGTMDQVRKLSWHAGDNILNQSTRYKSDMTANSQHSFTLQGAFKIIFFSWTPCISRHFMFMSLFIYFSFMYIFKCFASIVKTL